MELVNNIIWEHNLITVNKLSVELLKTLLNCRMLCWIFVRHFFNKSLINSKPLYFYTIPSAREER